MNISREYSPNIKSKRLPIIICSIIISAIYFGYVAHFILRKIRSVHQIYQLRDILMMGSAMLILVALPAFAPTGSSAGMAGTRTAELLTRIACALLAVSFAACGAASFSSAMVLPLFPSLNLGWLFVFAAGAALIAAWRPPSPSLHAPLVGIGALLIGFVVAEGPAQGLITAGTVAWNAASDFDFSALIPVVALVLLTERIVSGKAADDDDDRRGVARVVRESLAAAAVFILALGISLEPAVIAGATVVLVVASVWTVAPLVAAKRRKRWARWSTSCRRAVAWCATAGAIAIAWRGFAHVEEAAALSTLALAAIGLALGWTRPRDIAALLAVATRSMVVIGLGFIAAALWNLLANLHGDLASALRLLGVPPGAIFPAGAALLVVLTYWVNPVALVVVLAPVLYLGLESFAPAPVWAVPAVVFLVAMTMCLKLRFRPIPVIGVTGSGLAVAGIVAAFASPGLVGRDLIPRAAPSSARASGPGTLALADGTVRPADRIEANRWVRLRTWGQAPLRPYHGGSAFDSTRRHLLLFGADTHFRDWSNAVTAFDLNTQTWRRHARPSPRYAMRADEAGNRVSGVIGLAPWPMHTYDGVVYHPRLDALVVAAAPLHSLKAVARGRFDPTWIYDLKTRKWRIGPITGRTTPRFFGGTAIYDELRNAIFYFNTVPARSSHVPIGEEGRYFVPELYELGAGQRDWRKVSHAPPFRSTRFSAARDSRRDEIAVFAGDARDSGIRVYAFDDPDRASGTWRTRFVRGAGCALGSPYAVAYDDREGRFLFLPERGRTRRNLTCLYDPERDVVTRLKSAELPYLNMNYNLHYVSGARLFVLVSGVSLHGRRAEIRVIRLDRPNF